MSMVDIKDKHVKIAENALKAYETGLSRYWDAKTQNGKRRNYAQAFLNEGINMELLRHGQTLKPTGDNRRMFRYVKNIGEEPIDLYKLQQEYNIVFDLSEVTHMGEMFESAEIENAGIIDISATLQDSAKYNIYFLFAYSKIKRIEKFIVSETSCEFYSTFFRADYLEHCIFEGTIAKNGLSFTTANKLDYESLISVIDCLKDYSEDTSGTVWKVSFGPTNLNKLTTEDKERIEVKGWTYA